MRLPPVAKSLLAVLLLGSTVALAKDLGQFVPTTTRTPEQVAAEKHQLYNGYDKEIPQETEPFPWLAVGLAVIAFAIATPFAVRAYLNTANEIASTRPSPVRQSQDPDELSPDR